MHPHNRFAPIEAAACFAPAAVLALSLALCGLVCHLVAPAQSFAETTNIDAEVSAAQAKVEESAKAYDEAAARVEELQKTAAATQAEVDAIKSRLPEQQAKSDAALTSLYKMQREANVFLNLLSGGGNLNGMLKALDYITHLQDMNQREIVQLSSMKADLQAKQDQLATQVHDAKAEEAKAKATFDEAKELRKKAQAEAEARAAAERAAAEAAAKKAAEEAAKKKAAEEAAKKEAAEKRDAAKKSQESSSDDAADAGDAVAKPDGANWDSSKSDFVSKWAPRIDRYLSGSALAGQGKTFAAAAWDNGVDPRWSPAISTIESGKGESCFRSHNAWGWGSVNWDSWEEAINGHVRGLARGYGYTISVEGAKMYCPPNWQHWYSAVSKEMNSI